MNPKEFKKILVGVDDSPDAQLAFRYAMNRAKNDRAGLVIVSVSENDDMNVYQALSKDYVSEKRKQLMQHVAKYQQVAQRFGVEDVSTVVAEGNPGKVIVDEVIKDVKPDLLVIGAQAKSGIEKHFGSQAAYMAKYSPISVLVVR
ncbi:universal stress protein [Pediococcus ethanolidurans]|uniref:Nucleotide-binding universal stress protein, UspA family n=1 Tax=Pediococcus ethanolidurans TaxID=319653 RepID=A0A0R2K9J2_9LACO|nr:universal stress protein [Pediococcus ethanolidurans]KRN83159.1 UspA family nucleotide-binding protein [Pediococcus ethanolidurans]GEN95364.1 universal stress protein [Pediococcus ethanolidurans]SER38068.1 Nucleotide-binding universal stress protein, UspA family [Pediococcus ethanolidurans]